MFKRSRHYKRFIVFDFVVGIANGIAYHITPVRANAGADIGTPMFMYITLEAVGIATTTLSIRSAGIVFGSADLNNGKASIFCAMLGR